MGELLNLVGLSTGVVLYAMLLAMVLRAAGAAGARARFDPLLVATSVLGILWNLCALAVYEFPRVGIDGPFPAVAAAGFSALGFLPAVVVHSVLRGDRDGVRGLSKTSIAAVAYAVAALAAALHIRATLASSPVPAAAAMRLLTYTFVVLVLPLAVVTRRQAGSRRAMWGAALAIFAVSALHLSQLHRGDASWPVELVGHHASLPLAFAILYQDYPFALADLFLKRALSLLAIVTLAFAGIATFGTRSIAFAQFLQHDPRQVGVLVTLCVATALVYPSLRRVTAHFVDRILLRRPDYPSLRAALIRRVQAHDQVATLLPEVCALLAPALSAEVVAWREWRSGAEDEALGGVVLLAEDAAAMARSATATEAVAAESVLQSIAAAIVLPTTDVPRYVLLVAGLSGGRRILSDDRATLEAISIVVARRIDAIRMTDERYEREIRVQEMGKLASQAELRALRAQVNPHFLFNALTTIGYLIQTAPPRALETLMQLTTLLRAVLRSEGEFTTLGRELEMIESYLDIERARFEQRLRVVIDVPPALRNIRVPPLLLQPLVENAVKHGIAPLRAGGDVRVRATIEHTSAGPRALLLVVQDTGAGATADALRQGRQSGVGLRNVERRLAGQYGGGASLTVHSAAGHGTTVEIRMPPDARVTPEPVATAAAS
ncbi:MAG: histidine kinase [Acidobacteriota bacterium]